MNGTIRLATVEDAEAMLDVYRPYVERTAVSFELDPPDVAEFENRIAHTLERYPWLVLECGGVIVGYAYAGPLKSRAAYSHSVEVSIYLREDERGQGLGRWLYDSLEALLRELGVTNLYACITYSDDEHDPYLTRDSVFFHEHVGYTRVGAFHNCGRKFDRWYSVVWMEKILHDKTLSEQALTSTRHLPGKCLVEKSRG